MADKARLWLVRHGETTWNQQSRLQGQSDTPLSARGERQAARLGARLVREEIDAVYASDLERAWRTADLLVLLNPEATEEVRDRGLVLAALDCYSLAARDLEAYLAAAPQAADAQSVRARAAELRRKASRVH